MEDLFSISIKTAVFGFLAGLILGFISKKVMKLILFIIIVLVLLFQLSIFNGFVHLEWLNTVDIAGVMENLDLTFKEKIMTIIKVNLPFIICGVIGYLIGLKKG